ncbi:MAG: hypothetical protein BWX47_01964 [candidate division Hyd24-12 bacterium ADurb.Bin004]|nr:MAG: hypothetical protein BWX47_01964 [candidate division Hyd24-12 bacterium ADurb.Bin004]
MNSLFARPTCFASSVWRAFNLMPSVLASSMASITTFSGTWLHPPSSITTSLPRTATTMSSSVFSSSEMVGFTMKRSPMRPTLTADTGPFQGMSETMSEAEAPSMPRRSGSFSESELMTMQ